MAVSSPFCIKVCHVLLPWFTQGTGHVKPWYFFLILVWNCVQPHLSKSWQYSAWLTPWLYHGANLCGMIFTSLKIALVEVNNTSWQTYVRCWWGSQANWWRQYHQQKLDQFSEEGDATRVHCLKGSANLTLNSGAGCDCGKWHFVRHCSHPNCWCYC